MIMRNELRHDAPLLTLPTANAVGLSARASAMVFADPRSRAVHRLIDIIGPSEATALVIGETGTGKEIIARAIHERSRRAGKPFVAVNCGAFAEHLVDSELFGHEAGSFTGATGTRAGWFEAANGGTLFLDEIGDLPLALQVKLLRVLQEREVVRVGSRTPIPVDVRLVAATNVELQQAVLDGRFRADLYYRLRVVAIELPPLRERPGDILPLAEHFLDVYVRRLQSERILGDDAQRALLDYPWPGNIRELENVIHRAVLIARDNEIQPEDLQLANVAVPEPVAASTPQVTAIIPEPTPATAVLREAIEELIDAPHADLYHHVLGEVVQAAYTRHRGNQGRAAEVLGLSRNTYRTLLKRYGLLAGEGRSGRIDPLKHHEILSRLS